MLLYLKTTEYFMKLYLTKDSWYGRTYESTSGGKITDKKEKVEITIYNLFFGLLAYYFKKAVYYENHYINTKDWDKFNNLSSDNHIKFIEKMKVNLKRSLSTKEVHSKTLPEIFS